MSKYRVLFLVWALVLGLVHPSYAAQDVDLVPVNVKILSDDTDVTDSATKIPSTALKGRKSILIQNISGVDIFLGGSTVTTLIGYRLQDGEAVSFDLGSGVDVYGIAASGSRDVRSIEIR